MITVEAEGKQIRLGASGNTPFLYMSKTGRDINKDLSKIMKTITQQAEDDNDIPLTVEDLQIFANLLYVMAYQGAEDKTNFPKSPEEYLEELDSVFSIYQLLPSCVELWGINAQQTVESKKNLARVRGK